MEITEVRIKLADESSERLRAFCSITIDGCFVVRDLKIIHGLKGPFVAMPSRKLTDRCPRCFGKNCLRAVYCSQCGTRLPAIRGPRGTDGRARLYADIAHPINSSCREAIQARVLHAFEQEQILARQPGYVCRYEDFADEDYDLLDEWHDPPRDLPEESIRRRAEGAQPVQGPHGAESMPDRSQSARHLPEADEFGAGIITDEA